MTAKLLMEVALRVMGLWYAFVALLEFAHTAQFFFSSGAVPMSGSSFAVFGALLFVQGILGAALVYWAPSIAIRLYPPEEEPAAAGEDASAAERPAAPRPIGPGDLYRVACFIFGVYLLVQTAAPASRMMVALIGDSWSGGQIAVDAGTTLVYAFAGGWLVFGSRQISAMLSSLRYDPDTIPQQKYSLAVLLVVLVLVAIVLVVIRRTTVGVM